MKLVIKIVLITICEVAMLSCKERMEPKAEPVKTPAVQTSPTVSPVPNSAEILSKDYYIAENALKKALLEKDKSTVKLGLKSSILTIRRKTVEAIEGFGDVAFVPSLIDAISENQIILEGGTETKVIQKELNLAIISALERLTKIEFDVSEELSPEDIDLVIRKSREWLHKHKSREDVG